MGRLTDEQARASRAEKAKMISRQIETQWLVGNFNGARIILAKHIAEAEGREVEITDEYECMASVPLARVAINVRTWVALEQHGFRTVGDLQGVTAEQLLRLPQFGVKTVAAIRAAIRDLAEKFTRSEQPLTTKSRN